MTATLPITLVTCAVLGFRHGFDYDHIAAISDITSVQTNARDSMKLGLAYALGHAAMIALLGSVVICFQLSLPRGIDAWAERVVGLTLVLLALYVFGTLLWGDPKAAPVSRAALLIRSFRWLRHSLGGRHKHALAGDEALNYTSNYTVPAAFGVGIIHGLGAETPSQLALLLLAANLGGISKGFLGMGMFLAGLLLMNTLMTAGASGLFRASASRPRVLQLCMGLTAVYSLVVGILFLLGSSSHLPSISG